MTGVNLITWQAGKMVSMRAHLTTQVRRGLADRSSLGVCHIGLQRALPHGAHVEPCAGWNDAVPVCGKLGVLIRRGSAALRKCTGMQMESWPVMLQHSIWTTQVRLIATRLGVTTCKETLDPTDQ